MAARRDANQNMAGAAREPPLLTTAAQKLRQEITHWRYYIDVQAQRNTTPTFLEVQRSTQRMESTLDNIEMVDLTTEDSILEFTTIAYSTISLWEDMGYV